MIKPVLFVISAPSGAGKSTLIQRIRAILPDLFYSVSYTTRSHRQGEMNSIDYYFVDKEKFLEMIQSGAFLEWKEVHGSMYGTPLEPIRTALKNGRRCVMDIDVQGALEVFAKMKESIGIFISPPDSRILEERLRSRGSDSEESIKTRLQNAARELQFSDVFPYQIVNLDLERATQELIEVIRRESEY
ncbi:MAG: guanylate kinase [Deltaproteobacteria bacterium]|nr:guanylate kinase [Deltaproteobacteria bacterium]